MSDTPRPSYGVGRWVFTGLLVALFLAWIILSILDGKVTPSAWLGMLTMSLLIASQIKAWRTEVRRAERGES